MPVSSGARSAADMGGAGRQSPVHDAEAVAVRERRGHIPHIARGDAFRLSAAGPIERQAAPVQLGQSERLHLHERSEHWYITHLAGMSPERRHAHARARQEMSAPRIAPVAPAPRDGSRRRHGGPPRAHAGSAIGIRARGVCQQARLVCPDTPGRRPAQWASSGPSSGPSTLIRPQAVAWQARARASASQHALNRLQVTCQ